MALTAAEATEVRRQAGYPAAGVAPDDALAAVLAGISPEGEAVVRNTYLPALALMEKALTESSDSLDTQQAAVWHRNPQELLERSALYRSTRLALCRFLGIEPGPGMYDLLVVDPTAGGGTLANPPAVLVL